MNTDNVEFRKGWIQDLALDLERLDAGLARRPITDAASYRYAVCDKTWQLYRKKPYRQHFAFVAPRQEVPPDQARPFECSGDRPRHPKESKGQQYNATTAAAQCWDGGNGACS